MKTQPSYASKRQEILVISRQMIAAEEEHNVIQSLVEGLGKLMSYDVMAVYISDLEKRILEPIFVQGPQVTDKPNLSGWAIPFGAGIIGSVIDHGESERINNSHLDKRSVYPREARIPEEQMMVFSLKRGEHNWGALVINRISQQEFTADEFELAEFLASYASLALNNTTFIKKLREKERSQKALFDALPDSIYSVLKKDQEIKILERKPSTIIIDNECHDHLTANFQRAIESHSSVQFEYSCQQPSGIHYFEVRMIYINEAECLAIVRDLTEAKALQKQLQKAEALRLTIVDTISDAVITISKNGTILYVNDITEKIFGYRKDEMLDQHLDMLIPNFEREFQHQALHQYAQTKDRKTDSWIGLELSGTHKSNYPIPIEVSFGETSIDGEPIYSAIIRDITVRKKNESELVQAKTQAEYLMNVKQDFLTRMSHELRTPINGVLGLTNLMRTSELSKENAEYLKGIHSSGEHLLALINDILDLAKIEAGKLELVRQPFRIRDLLAGLIEGLMPNALQKGLDLSYSIDSSIPERLMGDAIRVNQILLNLLSNALKFTHSGRVSLRCQPAEVSQRFGVEFIVHDTGIGIPQQKLITIFESFAQADEQTSIKYGGTGLGLSIVKDLSELQGGYVTVQSEINKGSTFHVLLPLEPCEDAEDEAAKKTDQIIHFGSFRNSKVLVAEDNKTNQLVVRSTLEQWAIQVTVVNNGLEALQKLQTDEFDLVIMDVQMPEMDGMEATRKIRSEFSEPARSIPIIAMTASVLYDPIARVKAAGMNDYIPKPFKMEELYNKLLLFLKPSDDEVSPAPRDNNKSNGQINLTFINTIAPNNPDFVLEMLNLFGKQSVSFLQSAKAQILAKDYSALSKNAHSFKPQGAYLGVDSLKEIVGKLESTALEGTDVKTMTKLIAESEVLIEVMNKEISEIKVNL